MRRAISLVVLGAGLLAVSRPCVAKQRESRSAAQDPGTAAALGWLAMVDAGRYGESWDEASTYFQDGVPRESWVAALLSVRGPLGAVMSRTPQTTVPKSVLPGAPDGEYLVMQYGTVFARRAGAIETVVCKRDGDGRWRVSGYFVK